MKVSLVTVVYNGADTIRDTIVSVLSQTYRNIEYIIIDGASTDSTLNVINEYSDSITHLISEPDNGLYFAINKGIKLATGDVVGVLNADDFYSNDKVIENIVSAFKDQNVQSVYSDLVYVDKDKVGKVVRYWKSGIFKRSKFKMGWMPPHPTFFVERKVYDQYGLFNTKFKISADYELMLRFLYVNHVSVGYLPETTVKMRVGGKSNVSINNRLTANAEDRMAWKVNGLGNGTFATLLKPLIKINQFLIR